jgi:hypothetical protein
MKLKSNRNHYQGQNKASKSAIHIQGLLLKCHIIYFLNQKKLNILPQVHMLSLHYLKNFSSKFWLLTPFQRCQRLLIDILTFLNYSYTCGLEELVAWQLVGKMGVTSQTWKETKRNRFLPVLHRNYNYIVFILKTHWNYTTSTCVTC